MNDHWPILASIALIFLAATMGVIQEQNNASSAASMPVPTSPKAADNAPAISVQPQPNAVAPTASTQPLNMITTGSAPSVPVSAPAMNFTAGKATREQAFVDLRAYLQTKVNGVSMDMPGGGFAFKPVGARLEVLPQPNNDWRISIYNELTRAQLQAKTPVQESENFNNCMAAVVQVLAIDMTPKPLDRGEGRTSLRTHCKLGSIVVERDPNNGNSLIITPILQTVTAAPPAAVPAAPVQTAAPLPAPVTVPAAKRVVQDPSF